MYKYVKRLLDIFFSIVILTTLAIPLLIIAVAVKLESPGTVLFRQKRTGKDLKPFYMYKFRSMVEDTPSEVATNDFKDSYKYITHTGKFLRRTGLDELPQLLNILRGEMSFVGPRPVILSEASLIKEREQYNANSQLPGITGWAQANGRDTVSIKDKARMDGEYAQNFGWRMDLECIVRTIITIFNAEGFSEGSIKYDEYRQMVIKATKKRNLSQRVKDKLKRILSKKTLGNEVFKTSNNSTTASEK